MKRAAALALAALMLLMAGCAIESPRAKVSRSSVKPSQRSAPTFGEVYVVTKGDTLYSIAFRNNLDYRQLAEWNGIGSDYRINIGQRLRLTPPGAAATGDVATQAPQRVAPTQSAQPVLPMLEGAGTWEWPTRGSVARGFDAGGNKGLDIAGELGQIVVASRGGRVVYSGAALKGYGELVIIKHDEQYLSAYGYNRKRLVNEGEEVGPGQPIAELGEGPAQKPLLHFEIRDRGRPLDPRRLLPAR
ncbi:peptidoglycan DD-metalloendopeptidase family protein [Nevskia ramosa]|uniref:peptidoglycan DD-metalloendopeptidase family protein n=1 Tax=Nevskia ramosa TaxID=64002 RepID=UPI003D112453